MGIDYFFELPEGYQFTDENGNVINATKIVLEKKKKEYPKTYEECRRIMDIDTGFLLTSYDIDFWKGRLLTSLQKLLICRNAFWKIVGEEMGLGKPWEPTPDAFQTIYVIRYIKNNGKEGWDKDKIDNTSFRYILSFPTAEMRDAFYEAFKELIEECKELL